MKENIQDDKLVCLLETISTKLEHGKDLVSSDLVIDFQSKVNQLKENLANIKEKERVLRIGIVGEVKAGKSSFLNALIFQGESILPKAPTPMTAALTKIGYAEKPYARIVFYTDYDWEKITSLRDECRRTLEGKYQIELDQYYRHNQMISKPTFSEIEARYKHSIPKHIFSCYELLQLAEKSSIDAWEFLGKTKVVEGGTSLADFMEELNQYVGSDGDFTPIVKHTEIYMNNPLLKDIEVIDTPGLNDPILSRSEKTKEFLMNCDVVFLLSYAGQFLGSDDIQLITTTLPDEGIQNAYLIGSKFDSGLLDYNKRKATFREAFQVSRRNFNEQAAENIQECLRGGTAPKIISNIKDSLPPIYISSLMYAAAKKMVEGKRLSEEEENVIVQLEKRFSGFTSTPQFLLELANIDYVREKVFQEIKSKKEETILNRIEEITSSQKNKFLAILENINIAARHNLADLNLYDYEQLEKKLKNLRTKLNSIRSEVKGIFEASNLEAKRILKDLEIDVSKEIDNFLGVSVSTRTETYYRSRSAGFLGLRKEHYTVTETINTANVQEVTASLRKYTVRAKEIVNEEFRNLFKVETLKANLKNAVIGAFDLSDETFNENDILLPIEIVLGKLSIPSIELDISGHDEEIIRKFSTGVVEGNSISELIYEQEKMLSKISKDIIGCLKTASQQVENTLLEEATVFVDNIEEQLAKNVEIVQNLLKDKEENMKQFAVFIEQLIQFKGDIRKI